MIGQQEIGVPVGLGKKGIWWLEGEVIQGGETAKGLNCVNFCVYFNYFKSLINSVVGQIKGNKG